MALDTTSPRSRRALLLGAVGGMAALAAQAIGRPMPVRAQDELIQVGHTYNTATSRTSLKNATNNATVLVGESTGAGTGVYGSSGSNYGVYGQSGSSVGVGGYSSSNRAVSGYSSSGVGVYGFSNGVGKSSVIGFKANAGTAVYGEIISAASTDAAVAGWTNGTGPGMRGVNNNASGRGLWGQAQGSGEGVFGESATGIGGFFAGGMAQLKLQPKAAAGKPTSGAHTKGELYMDSNAALFVCTANGTPGTWRKVTTTAT